MLYLGDLTSFVARNDIIVFSDMGYDIIALNIGVDYLPKRLVEAPDFTAIVNLHEGDFRARLHVRTRRVLRSLFARVGLDASRAVVALRRRAENQGWHPIPLSDQTKERLLGTIAEERPSFIYCFWGTQLFPYINAIKDACPRMPAILDIETYPVYDYVASEQGKANAFEQRVFRSLDGRIHCTQRMHDYLVDKYGLRSHGEDIVLMHFLSQRYFFTRRLQLLSDLDSEPHVTFIGNTRFSDRSLDVVRSQLGEITEQWIHVHFGSDASDTAADIYVHPFPWFRPEDLVDGRLANFMTQFDACVVLYNCSKGNLRFQISLPAGFLFALTAGIPIVMPKGYFAGCEEIVSRYQIGFAYDTVQELKAKLLDRCLMRELRANAVRIAPDLTFEKNFHMVEAFIARVVESQMKP